MAQQDSFSNRWGFILASLGMAIGAGNLWRFPRLAGQYGGTFLLLWFIFLLVWSIPILLAEFSIGKKYKEGVINSFSQFAGKSFTWMGFFITVCTLGILFYYSVVTAWGLRYFFFSAQDVWAGITGGETLAGRLAADPAFVESRWENLANKNGLTIGLHIFSVCLGVFVLYQGIQGGLERATRFLIPALFVLLVLMSVMALNMDNGIKGLNYMFTIRPELFSNPVVWIEALSQSAWSTGAGWGLIMTLAAYTRVKEDVTLNTFISGFGNNTASLLAGFAILPAVFALAPSEGDAITYLQSGNQALTFNVIPRLFSQIPGGSWLGMIFFMAFFFAAFSSLLAMLELFIKVLRDTGLNRHQASLSTGVACICLGLPSAWSLDFFNNQDWVWGIGLVISGLFILFAVLRHGMRKFKAEFIDLDSDFRVPDLYFLLAVGINLGLGVILIYWWMSQGYDPFPWFDKSGNWNLISIYSNATIVTQWGMVLLAGILLNRWLYKTFISRTF